MHTNTLEAFLKELASTDAKYENLTLNMNRPLRARLLPVGWKKLIHDFFIAFNEIRQDWLIEELKEDWGSLSIELTCIRNSEDKKTQIR